MAINFLYPTNTRPEIQINDTDDNPRLAFLESDLVSGGISTTGGNLVFEASSGIERARILSGGNFGIDNTDPKQKLSVAGIINSDSNKDYYGAWLSGNSTAGSQNYLGLGVWYSEAGYVRYFANDRLSIYTYDATEDVTLQEAGGKVGIGITTPVSVFQVQETQNAESLITLSNNRQDAGDVPIFGIVAQNAGTNVAKISFYREGGSSSGHLAFSTKASNSASLTEKMRIDANGEVGIGTDNPLDMLHVKNLDAVGGNGRCDIRLENGLGYAEFGVLSNYARIQANAFEVAAMSRSASYFYTDLASFGAHLTTDTTDGIVSINGGSGTGGEAYLRLMRNNVAGFLLNHTASAIQVRATANIPMFFYTNDTIGIKLNANSTVSFSQYGAGYLKTDGNGLITADSTVPGTGTFLPLAGGTMTGTIVGPTAGSSSANPPALEVVASGTGDSQASIAIQQKTSEGDTIIFADYEPHVEWGISTENSANEIQFTAGSSTNSLGSKILYNNAGNARTAYVKFNHNLSNGNTEIGGTLDVGQALTVSSTATANSFTSSTDTGISINGITMTRVAANSAIRVSNGLETLGLLRSYAGLNVATSAVIGSTTQGNTLIVTSAQAALNTAFSSAGNGGYTQYQSGDDGIYGYIGTGSHLLSPVVNDNDFVARAQGEFVVSLGATEKLRIASNQITAKVDVLELSNDFSIQSTDGNYWQRIKTLDSATSSVNTFSFDVRAGSGSFVPLLSLRQDGVVIVPQTLNVNGAGTSTFIGPVSGIAPTADLNFATKKYVDDSITGGANYLGVWDPDDSLNNGYGDPSLQASGRTDDSGDYFICSADGAAHPNGGTSEPDSWHVGDWVIWNEDLGTGGLWQKLDNTTVLSGGGTTNSIAKFTDNETIGDSLLKDTGTLGYITSNSELFQLQGTTASGYAEIDIGNDLNDKLVIGSIGSTYSAADWANSTYIYNNGTGRNMYLKSVTDMMFFAGGLALAQIRMTVKASGNVGIGTDSPDTKLMVSGEILSENSNGGYFVSTRVPSSSSRPTLNFYGTALDINYVTGYAGSGASTAMTILSGGNVGIGETSPKAKLNITGVSGGPAVPISTSSAGIIRIESGNGGQALDIGAQGASPYSMWLQVGNASNSTGDTYPILLNPLGGNVGIGTTSPEAKLDITNGAGKFCVDSKTHALTNAFTTCLTVNLDSHTGCYVTLTCFGDWGSHSSAAYRGEFFLQNGANSYNEPGIILRQDDNTSVGTDQIVCQLLDPTGTGNPKDFAIQIRTTATSGTTGFTGQLTYTVQGKFNSIT